MRVLVDTPIWSAAFRRAEGTASASRRQLELLIADGAVEIIGPIRQELLSGIRDKSKFDLLRRRLRVFPDLEITPADYESAAACCNQCRAEGIQGSSTDFLICAIAIEHGLSIFTDDRDFIGYQKVLPVRLHPSIA